MKEPGKCENMDDIRFAIDQIDREIVGKIALRAGYVAAAARFKNSEDEVRDEARVRRVIESKKVLAEELGVSPELIADIYETMIDYFISEEVKAWKKNI